MSTQAVERSVMTGMLTKSRREANSFATQAENSLKPGRGLALLKNKERAPDKVTEGNQIQPITTL